MIRITSFERPKVWRILPIVVEGQNVYCKMKIEITDGEIDSILCTYEVHRVTGFTPQAIKQFEMIGECRFEGSILGRKTQEVSFKIPSHMVASPGLYELALVRCASVIGENRARVLHLEGGTYHFHVISLNTFVGMVSAILLLILILVTLLK